MYVDFILFVKSCNLIENKPNPKGGRGAKAPPEIKPAIHVHLSTHARTHSHTRTHAHTHTHTHTHTLKAIFQHSYNIHQLLQCKVHTISSFIHALNIHLNRLY